MTIEPVTGLGSALRLPRARVVPLSAPPSSYTSAVERYLTGAGIAKSSARIYRISLTTWGVDARRRTGADRTRPPGREAAVFSLAAIDDPALPEVLAELAAARADEMDADTVNRELPIARKAIGWWQRQGWIDGDPTAGPRRSSRGTPGSWPTRSPHPRTSRTSRTWTASHSTGSATEP
ncbi:hypothetical protein OG596_31050 [Streptomyces sp. NBC_01102]|uniref:hypothetical protein n=1 Tax=unclassified Streptomyces TaxID=2593676 RepID=UPI00386A46AC|nr:hypothetical protein OG596_31050 [Streptomyces sp. NBC_01102]